jgi:hypothetical protein
MYLILPLKNEDFPVPKLFLYHIAAVSKWGSDWFWSEVDLPRHGLQGPMGMERSKTDLKFEDPHFEPFTFGKIVSSYAGYIWLYYKVYIYKF